MSFSLNELEALAKRATRGAGYSWGQAEEASKAARWLCAQGLDGAGILAGLLERGLASQPVRHRPQAIYGPWQSDGALCPLSAGPLLSDCAHLLWSGAIGMKDVAAPVLLLPFAANAARGLNSSLTVELDNARLVTDGTRISIPDPLPTTASRVFIARGGELEAQHSLKTRAHPKPEDWATLNRFAHRTYAPATEESRLLGAGAGVSDND